MTTMPRPRPSDDDVRAMPLDAAFDELLAEIVVEPAAARPTPTSTPTSRRRTRWPLAGVAAAAAVALVLGVPAVLLDRRDAPSVDLPRLGFAAGETAPSSAGWTPPTNLVALDAPGWVVDVESVFSNVTSVGVGYRKGDAYVGLTWTVARRYRAESSVGSQVETTPIRVLGVGGRYLENGDAHSIVTPPRGRYFLAIGANGITEAELRALLRDLRPVDTLDVPDEVVDPTEVDGVAADVYGGAELPVGFSPPAAVGWNDEPALLRMLAGNIRCGWAQAYVDGDRSTRAEVVAALERSASWPLVQAEPETAAYFTGLRELIDREDDPELVRGCPDV